MIILVLGHIMNKLMQFGNGVDFMIEGIIESFIFVMAASIMMGIGIAQIRSRRPVGFYSGERPPRPNQLKSVSGWNFRHGMMWILYGVCIILSRLVALFFRESVIALIPYAFGIVLPLIAMNIYHLILVKKYVIR